MILRDYQVAASEAIPREWREVDSTLVVLPTGTGKTILFADVIRKIFPRRAMVIGHREELIWQARDKIKAATGLSCEVEMGDYRAHDDLFSRAMVIVSTIQTQCSGADGGGRMGKFDPQKFGVLIIDEAHHATSPSYRRVIDYYRTNKSLKVLGVTATPDRADEQALGQVFQSVAFDYEILEAIRDGWLVPIEQQLVNVEGLDFSSIRTTAGDLNGADLAAVMEAEKNLHEIASSSIDIIGSRRSIVFSASVKHAETLANIFNRHRSGMAAWVCGKTPKDDRRKILADFASGKVQVVANCLDSETEILTRRGWIGIDDIESHDVTATMNITNRQIEWQPISRIVKRSREKNERIVGISNQGLDVRVTEGHRMVLGRGTIRASSLPEMTRSYRLPVSGLDMALPGVPLSNVELEFLGLFATDGSLNIPRASIEIVQAKTYSKNCTEIERILTGCEFDWRRTDGGNYWRYRIPKGNISGQLKGAAGGDYPIG